MEIIRRIIFFILPFFLQKSHKPEKADVPLPTLKKDVEVLTTNKKWYLGQPMRELLEAIIKHEGGKYGYNADYRNNQRWALTGLTFDEVRALSRLQVTKYKEASSAIGAYQFLTKTLDSLKKNLRLTGGEIFNEDLQDDLAVALMIRRGLLKYLRGEISEYDFGNNLAKEWASLPVVSGKKKGRSYYAGDGLNKSFHSVESILTLIRELKKLPLPENTQ